MQKHLSTTKIVAVMAVTLLLNACTEQSTDAPSKPSAQLIMPLLAECEQQLTTAFLNEHKIKPDFNFEFISYNLGLKPLPSLRGYVQLTSQSHSFNDLVVIVQDAGAGCMPDNSRRIALRDPRFADKIIQTMSLAQREGARHLYSNVSGDDLEIYFSKSSSKK